MYKQSSLSRLYYESYLLTVQELQCGPYRVAQIESVRRTTLTLKSESLRPLEKKLGHKKEKILERSFGLDHQEDEEEGNSGEKKLRTLDATTYG